jgi:hypothetical protein
VEQVAEGFGVETAVDVLPERGNHRGRVQQGAGSG